MKSREEILKYLDEEISRQHKITTTAINSINGDSENIKTLGNIINASEAKIVALYAAMDFIFGDESQ